jgi:hypothetical protein
VAFLSDGGKPVLFVRRTDILVPRPLTETERRRIERALIRCRVGGPALAARAVAVAILYPRRPSLVEVRGPRSLVAHVALAARADGIALGRRVFIRRELFEDDGSLPIDLVAHEVTHVAQYLKEGPARFYARYLKAYAAARSRGLDDHSAYLAIPYEVEARNVATCVR